jgi:hypothetical protein
VNGARAKPWFGPDRSAKMSVARAKLTAPGDGRFAHFIDTAREFAAGDDLANADAACVRLFAAHRAALSRERAARSGSQTLDEIR